MADSVPMISVSAEAEDENFSLSDSEEANKAKTLIASRMRRRHKQKKKTSEPAKLGNISLVVDDGDESGLTDVETVEVEGDASSDNSKSSTPAEDFTPVFDSALKPQIVQIIEDHEGKTHVKTIVQGVVAALDSDESDADDEGDGPRLSLIEALTDIEDLEDSLEESDGRSDSSEMNRVINQLELGGNVETHNQEEEVANRPAPQYQSRGNTSMLLCPKSASGRKKTRKTRTKKKASASTGSTLLTVSTPDDPVTDVESVSGMEEDDDQKLIQDEFVAFSPGLKVQDVQDEGATDVEDFPFSDDDELPAVVRLQAPGILVTGENSETESSYDCSGRSSRLGLTDVESVHGVEDDSVSTRIVGLSLPVNTDDPVTDVEDIDNVEEEAPMIPPTIPRNGPALHVGQQQIVTIQEDENGRVTSRKYAGSPGLLGFVDSSQQEEGGTTDVEYVGASADEDEGQPRGVTPEIEMFSGSTVRVKRHSLTSGPPVEDHPDDVSDNEGHAASNYSLMPPVQAVEILTDTEDMEMSDGETTGNPEAEDQAASAACQQYDPTCSAISASEPSLPSQPDWSDSAQGGM